VRRLDTFEQLRPVDLAVVHQHVCVDLGRCREVPLSDARSDLGPAHPSMVKQADPAMTKIVRAEDRHPGVATCPGNCHPKAIGRADREQRRLRVTVLSCR
jgi:purine nucleoside phosphorylase